MANGTWLLSGSFRLTETNRASGVTGRSRRRISTACEISRASIGLSLAGLAAAAAYGSGPVIIWCGIPMLVIANAYRRLNLWSANCGASFEWVGGRSTRTSGSSPGG